MHWNLWHARAKRWCWFHFSNALGRDCKRHKRCESIVPFVFSNLANAVVRNIRDGPWTLIISIQSRISIGFKRWSRSILRRHQMAISHVKLNNHWAGIKWFALLPYQSIREAQSIDSKHELTWVPCNSDQGSSNCQIISLKTANINLTNVQLWQPYAYSVTNWLQCFHQKSSVFIDIFYPFRMTR